MTGPVVSPCLSSCRHYLGGFDDSDDDDGDDDGDGDDDDDDHDKESLQ